MTELTIAIPMEEDEPLGAVPNDKMVIVKVQPGTIADGKLMIGDQILKVNNVVIKDANHFFQLLHRAAPMATLIVNRDQKKAVELLARVNVPPERAKFILRRDGYSYMMAKIELKPGGKLGMAIKHYQNRVLVSRVDENSLASEQLQVGDHLIDIDGRPVSDKDVCRQLMMHSLKSQRFFTSVVERPETMEAKQWVKAALIAASDQAPSVKMNSDVREIAAKQREKMGQNIQPQRAMVGTGDHNQRVKIQEKQPSVFVIASDNEGKQLRHVKKA